MMVHNFIFSIFVNMKEKFYYVILNSNNIRFITNDTLKYRSLVNYCTGCNLQISIENIIVTIKFNLITINK